MPNQSRGARCYSVSPLSLFKTPKRWTDCLFSFFVPFSVAAKCLSRVDYPNFLPFARNASCTCTYYNTYTPLHLVIDIHHPHAMRHPSLTPAFFFFVEGSCSNGYSGRLFHFLRVFTLPFVFSFLCGLIRILPFVPCRAITYIYRRALCWGLFSRNLGLGCCK